MKEKFKTYIPFFLMVVMGLATGYAFAGLKPVETMPLELSVTEFNNFQVYNTPQPLPDVELFGIDGEAANLNDLKGKWRLVNFWATWCAPCVTELPLLLELKGLKADKNFEVIFVSLDFPGHVNFLKERMKTVKVPSGFHTFYVKELRLWDMLSIRGVPTSILVDPKGQMHFKVAGDVDWMGKETLAFIDNLLEN